ncbi:MAG: hypothetical protein AAFN74_22350 [Myxococcota bacterium]
MAFSVTMVACPELGEVGLDVKLESTKALSQLSVDEWSGLCTSIRSFEARALTPQDICTVAAKAAAATAVLEPQADLPSVCAAARTACSLDAGAAQAEIRRAYDLGRCDASIAKACPQATVAELADCAEERVRLVQQLSERFECSAAWFDLQDVYDRSACRHLAARCSVDAIE